ncbi:NADPH-dependent FMN reductase-domain-containing protein [Lipomyces japonicus]|uniref:NADPH-dependent FMN reductase-domain-containing protein n=1 Tax=Lipomyces japonicus TaxID=56871 RepID=UPI0034CDC296
MTATEKPVVYIIIGSVRVVRQGPLVAEWIKQTADSTAGSSVNFEIVDLKDWDLPIVSLEPYPAARGIYTQPNSIAWSEKIKKASGFIFLTPVYNGSYTAALKNAIDYLKREWDAKPAGIVTYSFRGSLRAVPQLQAVLGDSLRMDLAEPSLALKISDLVEDGKRTHQGPGLEQATEELKKLLASLTEKIIK